MGDERWAMGDGDAVVENKDGDEATTMYSTENRLRPRVFIGHRGERCDQYCRQHVVGTHPLLRSNRLWMYMYLIKYLST